MISGAFVSFGVTGNAYEVEVTDYHQELRQMIPRDELDSMDFSDVSTGEPIPAITPGDVLRLDFMEPLKLSARALAREMGAAPDRVTEIVDGRRAITTETAILLGRRFKTAPHFWMNLQTAYDLEKAERNLARVWLLSRGYTSQRNDRLPATTRLAGRTPGKSCRQ